VCIYRPTTGRDAEFKLPNPEGQRSKTYENKRSVKVEYSTRPGEIPPTRYTRSESRNDFHLSVVILCKH
jgi:hypothetical protein